MAKPKPGGRRPRKRERKNVTVRRRAHQELVQQHDRRRSPTGGQRHLVGLGRQRRLQGLPQVARRSPPRWPPRGRPRGHGARRAQGRRLVKGPGSGRETAIRSHPEHRHRGHRHQRRHPRAAQRLPPAQAAQDLIDMARYTGPKVRVSRRLGINIFENDKGRKALERRPYPPGEHGRTRRRNAGSEYLLQLQEKQKAKLHLRRARAAVPQPLRGGRPPAGRRPARTCCACSSSASTTSCSAPAGPRTRPQARQFVSHGHIKVNGKRVDIPSYRVRKGDVVSAARRRPAR